MSIRPSIVASCSALVALLLCSSAAADSLKSFSDMSVDVGTEHVEVRVFSVDRLGSPRLATRKGMVMAWFPGMIDQRIERPVEGRVLQRVRMRPGAGNTAVLKLELADRRRLDVGDVQVQRMADGFSLRIARDVLPGASKAAVAAKKAPAQSAAAEPQQAKRPTAEDTTPDTEADTVEDDAVDSDVAGAETAPTGLPTRKSADPVETLGKSSGSPNLMVLVLISLLLGVVYGFIRVFQGRKQKRVDPLTNIEVIGTRRLGPRHQLMVVRALGEDHLLSMNAGQTERIASIPSPGPGEHDAPSAEHVAGLGLMSRLRGESIRLPEDDTSSVRRGPSPIDLDAAAERLKQAGAMYTADNDQQGRPDSGVITRLSSRAEASAEQPQKPEHQFGAQLGRLVARSERVRARRRQEDSQAVEGLIRLRERAAS